MKNVALWSLSFFLGGAVPSYGVNPSQKNSSLEHYRSKEQESLKDFRAMLEQKIIGQPEVIDRLMQMERKRRLYQERDKPEIALYLTGLPGTGKDTTAHAYVDAIHEKVGASYDHLFVIQPVKSKADLWGVLGSSTGHQGANEISPFIKFLVEHSGGKYAVLTRNSGNGSLVDYVVEVDDRLSQARSLPKGADPTEGVVFINEFHNWPKEVKNLFLKSGMENGVFHIPNPNGGVEKIFVPITFILASNEGIELMTSRSLNGQRYGNPLSYEEMIQKYNRITKTRLRKAIMATNGGPNDRSDSESLGISEELLNRISNEALIALRPLSPKDLQAVAKIKLKQFKQIFKKATQRVFQKAVPNSERRIVLDWRDSAIEFVQEFEHVAEESARPIEAKINSLIRAPIEEAFQEGKFDYLQSKFITIDIEKKEDGTAEIVFFNEVPQYHTDANKFIEVDRKLLEPTLRTKKIDPISAEERDHLLSLGSRIQKKVFGNEKAIRRIAKSIAIRQVEKNKKTPGIAKTFILLGLTGTGKTQTANALSEEIFDEEESQERVHIMDLSGLKNAPAEVVKRKIFGDEDSRGNPIPSDFMKFYDKTDGKMVLLLDEFDKLNREAMTAFYPVFDNPHLSGFCDKEVRSMSDVIIIATGNLGDQWYEDIPQRIPDIQQQMAMEEVYRQSVSDPNYLQQFLTEFLPEPLIGRVSRKDIIFFSPHTFLSRRQLAQQMLIQSLEEMAFTEGKLGWHVQVQSDSEWLELLDVIDQEGMILRQQGRSLRHFVQTLSEEMKYTLLSQGVPSGETVLLNFRQSVEQEDLHADQLWNRLDFEFIRGNGEVLPFSVDGKQRVKELEEDSTMKMITGFHEAGHELVRHILLGEFYSPQLISIIPGVKQIDGRWLMYRGIAQHRKEKDGAWTRKRVVSEIAVLLAGDIAQSMVIQGAVTDSGKSNDWGRAIQRARLAIIHQGLSFSQDPGLIAPEGKSTDQFISQLSGDLKKLFNEEVQLFITEAQKLAYDVLQARYQDALIPLGNQLIEKGILQKEDLIEFYEEHEGAWSKSSQSGWWSRLVNAMSPKRWLEKREGRKAARLGEQRIKTSVPLPSKVADIDQIAKERRAEEIQSFQISKKAPLANKKNQQTCSRIFAELHSKE
ncbi:MAG: hypothetical protein CL678_17040 [Bdellovibrionaceae bacterium]|nr:hypothetical protein [Pseudobdellovibrionaceae bacterium]